MDPSARKPVTRALCPAVRKRANVPFWRVKSFAAGMGFFESVAQLAEKEGHHPDLHLERYRNVWIEIWTHSIGGLSEHDFALAAKIDELPVAL